MEVVVKEMLASNLNLVKLLRVGVVGIKFPGLASNKVVGGV